MAKIKIKVGFSFWLFAILCILLGQGFLLVNYMMVLFMHEYAHAYVAYKLGYTIKEIRVIPFGISLNMQESNLTPQDQIKIALAGPLVNIICAIVVVAIWWVLPISYNYTYLFCFANLTTAIFNFLPCFPMDGGRVLYGLINLKQDKPKTSKYCKIINVVVSILLLSLFVYSCFVGVNFTYLMVSLFIFVAVLGKDKGHYEFLSYISKAKPNCTYPIRQLAVDSSIPIYKLCSYINNNTYLHFVIINNGKPVFSFYESELSKILLKFLPTTKVGEIKLV